MLDWLLPEGRPFQAGPNMVCPLAHEQVTFPCRYMAKNNTERLPLGNSPVDQIKKKIKAKSKQGILGILSGSRSDSKVIEAASIRNTRRSISRRVSGRKAILPGKDDSSPSLYRW